jgi:hypothetical protein
MLILLETLGTGISEPDVINEYFFLLKTEGKHLTGGAKMCNA